MINALIRERGLSQTKLATRLKVTPSAVSAVIHGRARSERVARFVARAAHRRVSEFWPGAYPSLELKELKAQPADVSALAKGSVGEATK